MDQRALDSGFPSQAVLTVSLSAKSLSSILHAAFRHNSEAPRRLGNSQRSTCRKFPTLDPAIFASGEAREGMDSLDLAARIVVVLIFSLIKVTSARISEVSQGLSDPCDAQGAGKLGCHGFCSPCAGDVPLVGSFVDVLVFPRRPGYSLSVARLSKWLFQPLCQVILRVKDSHPYAPQPELLSFHAGNSLLLSLAGDEPVESFLLAPWCRRHFSIFPKTIPLL